MISPFTSVFRDININYINNIPTKNTLISQQTNKNIINRYEYTEVLKAVPDASKGN
jgi:hypothetical protein